MHIFIFWTFPYHQHSLLLDPARQAALFSIIRIAPDFPCTVDPSGPQRDWAELYWLGATTLTPVIGAVTFEGPVKKISHVLLTWGLLSPREEKCSTTEPLFNDCNNLDPAVYSLTPENQLWILISLAQWYWRLGVCSCSLRVCIFLTFPLFPRLYWIMSLSGPPAPYISSTVQQP